MKKIFLVLIISGLLFISSTPQEVKALSGDPEVCLVPFGIPKQCQDSYELDNRCNIAKIIDPEVDCCINKCKGDPSTAYNPQCPEGATGPDCTVVGVLNSLNIFGTKVQYSADKIPSLIQLVISGTLAVVSFYALFRGMYLYAIKRPNTTDATEVGKINKEFGNIIVGFVLAWSVIFIVEFVMRLLGLPTLTQISFERIDSGDPEVTNVIIIK